MRTRLAIDKDLAHARQALASARAEGLWVAIQLYQRRIRSLEEEIDGLMSAEDGSDNYWVCLQRFLKRVG